MVLLRTATIVQQDCGHPIPDSPRKSTPRGRNDQRTARCCSAPRQRSGGRGPAQPRAGGRYSTREGSQELGVRLGNWLTAAEARGLWQAPDPETLKGKRDRAILAVLLGCGLRRRELADLDFRHLQQREEHWAIVDLVGKGGHIRTVPVPCWVKATVDDWVAAAELQTGKLFRCVCRAGKCWGEGVTERLVWHVVKQYAGELGFRAVAPHDLRRSCAKLCHAAGGELEQIQFLLGHVSVQTTERYLGCKQRIRGAVNDRIGIEP